MTFLPGQIVRFMGRDASTRAELLAKELGRDGVKLNATSVRTQVGLRLVRDDGRGGLNGQDGPDGREEVRA